MTTRTRGLRRWRALVGAVIAIATVATVAPQTERFTGSGKAEAAPLPATDATKVPHYFGPYPNWANTPQVMPNALVAITGPIATAQASGGVDGVVVSDSGVGYVTPVVSFSAPAVGGTLAVATAAIVAAGTITITVTTPGSGYVTAPTVTITDAATGAAITTPAVATATIRVDAISVTSGATGYTSAPAVTITEAGGGAASGAGATATATTIDGNGVLQAIGVDTAGAGYTVPMVAVAPSLAAAEASATVDPKDGSITDVVVTSAGSGYTAPPTLTITAPGAHQEPFVQATAVATLATGAITAVTVDAPGFGYTTPVVTASPASTVAAVVSGTVDNLTLVDGGSNYMNQPIVEFSLPDLADGTQATGTAVMNAEGIVTSVSIVDPGSGYTTAPTVYVWDGNADNPTGAQVTATINVTRIDLTNIGSGYTTAPTLTIADTAPGTGDGAMATATIAAQGAIAHITVTSGGKGYLTPGLKKFVDTLPGLGEGGVNNLGNYLPVGDPDTTTYPGTDYYEIAVVQYRHQFHSDLPPTLLRGYVQLSTSVVPGNRVALSNANVDRTVADTPILIDGQPVYGVDTPHYLGPTILATKNRPVRILFRNLLPTGSAGDLFLPVDTSLMGSGAGPGKEGEALVGAMMLNPDGTPMEMAADQGTVLDGIRNPTCGNSPKPAGCYTENRAELHLHGGVTPWISDGTPHQWVTPANEGSAYPKGVSVSDVPDMPDPGPGAETFFYTNQQSARLMFYHDHAWGITRLNVYAGEAAPYIITDATEQRLFGAGGRFGDLGTGTPLVVQDKTFVPSDTAMAQQDPTWDKTRWGGLGSLWVPHVYMPAQNPGDATGMSSFGRWMYGPWFWPPATKTKYAPIDNPYHDPTCDPNVAEFCEPALIPGTPNISVGMEAFNDTPVVNGVAYPTTTVDPKSYRFRVLNAANDRFFNLSWYVADPTTGTLSEVALNPAELAAAQTDPVVFPTPDTSKSPAGPDWIQIASEGGFLPQPVVLPAQPTTWITDPTRFDVGLVDAHSLLLAPAERADVIVDFSQFRGKTLILYNDAPAAFPARVPGYDYYTGGPDLSPSGAPTTLPGYGPNTRTVMQIKVTAAAPGVRFDRPGTSADRLGELMAAFAHNAGGTGAFEESQHAPIVGQAAYNSAMGTNFVSAGWCNSPSRPTAKCDGFARIAEQGGNQFKFDTIDPTAQASTTVAAASDGVDVTTLAGGTLSVAATAVGFGDNGRLSVDTSTGTANFTYTDLRIDKTFTGLMQQESTVRAVTFLGVRYVSGSGVLATGGAVKGPMGQLAVPFEPKGIHDEMNSATFDEFGRMTANLGLEAPGATPLTQNIILYPYTQPATEILESVDFPTTMDVTPISSAADGTQIWKITHNGVDTHPIHFHLYDVQVINRVSWDNIVQPPEPNELGWKDTVRVNPLQDTIVAVRPIIPVLPFAIPDSRRPLNPMMPLGARGEQSGTLGSQAGFNNTDVHGVPIAPIINTVQNFHWEYVLHCHILSHEEMDMMRPVQVEVTWLPPVAPSATADVAGDGVVLSWNDPTAVLLTGAGEIDLVQANIDMKRAEIGFRIERSPVDVQNWADVGIARANATTYTDLTGVPGVSYQYKVTPWNEAGATSSAPVNASVVTSAPPAPKMLIATVDVVGPSVVLGWKAPTGAAVTSIVVQRATNGGAFTDVATLPLAGVPATTPTSWTDTSVTAGEAYQYQVRAVSAGGTSVPSAPPVSIRIDSTTTTLTHTPSPSAAGANVRFTARVTATVPGVVPTGMVTFTGGGLVDTTVDLDLDGVATLDTAALPAGRTTVTATYSGSLALLTSSATVTHAVRPAVSLSGDGSPAMYGDPVVFSAVVAPATATGTVTFTFDKGLLSEVSRTTTIVNGTATYTSSTLTVGSHSVVATYNGDTAFLSGTSPSMQQVITAIATTTALTSNRNPAQPTQVVTFTARVAESVSGAAVPAGVVTFRITNPGALATTQTVAVDTQGRATFATSSMSEATHVVTATYNATIPWMGSTSAPLSQVVAKRASSVSLVSSDTTTVFGQTVTFTATMNTVAAAGTVTFTIGTRKLVGVVDGDGIARVVVSNLAVGTHRVTATYSGSPLYNPSTSAALNQIVSKSATVARVVSSRNPAPRGSMVTFTATVTAVSPGVGVPSGTVRFSIGGLIRDVVLNQAGRASYSTSGLTVGIHTITATYLGNANFAGSTGSVAGRQRII